MPHHRGRCRQGREVLRWSERRDLLPGEVRMSNTHVGAHPIIPRMIRLFSVAILLGWLVLTVIVNVVVPQLETVGQRHAVSMAPNDAPSMQATKRAGQDFQEFDPNTPPLMVP